MSHIARLEFRCKSDLGYVINVGVWRLAMCTAVRVNPPQLQSVIHPSFVNLRHLINSAICMPRRDGRLSRSWCLQAIGSVYHCKSNCVTGYHVT